MRSAGRIATTPEALELFAQSLAPRRRVALEVDGQRGGDRADPRAARRAGGGRQPAATPAISRGAGEDRPAGRADAGQAAGGRVAGRGVDARRADAGDAPAAGAARAARARAHAREERDPRGADAPPEGPPAGQRRVRQGAAARGWPGSSCPSRSARRSTACLRQVDFLDGEIAAVERAIAARGARLARGAAADDRARAST